MLGIGTTTHFETGGLAPAGGSVSVSQITPSGGAVSGAVNPQNQLTEYRFEYATNPTFEDASVVGEGSFAKGIYPVELVGPAELSGLAPNTTYYVRLFAKNATGGYTTAATSFKTLLPAPPAVESWGASEGETVSQARLEGHVSPGYESTTCAFQYTPEAQYALEGFIGATEVPCASSPFGSNTAGFSEAVTATAGGLRAGVTYDYRLIAGNETGTAEAPIAPTTATFTTAGPPHHTTGPTKSSTSPPEGGTTTPPTSTTPTLPAAHGTTSPPPAVAHARQSATRWREGNRLASISRAKTPTGTTFAFLLNEQATVRFSFIQLRGATSAAHSCPAKTREDARRTRCNTVSSGALSFTGQPGTDELAFAGRISRSDRLNPGHYNLTITATNATGQSSTPVSLRFTIVK